MASHIHDIIRQNYAQEPELRLAHFTEAATSTDIACPATNFPSKHGYRQSIPLQPTPKAH